MNPCVLFTPSIVIFYGDEGVVCSGVRRLGCYTLLEYGGTLRGQSSVTFAKAQYNNLVCIKLEGSEVTGLTAPI